MSDALILLHTAITIIGIIALILVVRLNPAVVLVIGSLYLGIATGLGLEETAVAVAQGFGNLMAEIGLILGFGVLLGSLLVATGALQRIVGAMLNLFGRRGSPYAFSLSTGVVLPAIPFDVAFLILAPLARSVALRTGLSIAAPGAALAAGLEVGLLLVVPGSALLAVVALLDIDLGTMLLYGLLVGVPTILLTTFLYLRLLDRGIWNPEKDEAEFKELREGRGALAEQEVEEIPEEKLPSLPVSLAPILLPVILIIVGTIAVAVGVESGVLAFLANPVVALLLGLLLAYGLAYRTLNADDTEEAITDGLRISGLVLLFNGVAGSLGLVIERTGITDIVSGLFSASSFSPVLLVWFVAAFLRVAQGSATVAAIAAASIVAPIVGEIGISPVLVALAAGSGAAFAAHVSDNSFWLFKAFFGLSTRGTFKVYTLSQSMMSVISLVFVLALSLVL